MVTRLTPVVINDPDRPLPRLWLVFFGEGQGPAWWARIFRRGFRHVCAAAWYDDQQRWIFYNPTRRGTVIEIYSGSEFNIRLGQLLAGSAAALRVPSRFDRGSTPAAWHCVGAIKALLGIRSRALSVYGLYHDLIATHGAEIVETKAYVEPIQSKRATAPG